MTCTSINRNSPEGLYITLRERRLIWIVSSTTRPRRTDPRQKLAIALNPFKHFPQFSFIQLGERKFTHATYVGKTVINLISFSNLLKMPNRIGVLQVYRKDLILKGNSKSGDACGLIIKTNFHEDFEYSGFFDKWSLSVPDVANFPLFFTTEPLKASSYPI